MKTPTIALDKRDDRGGVYYWRAYLPRPDAKKGYLKVYRSTEVKDQVRALAIAKEALDAILGGKVVVSPVPVTEVIQAPQSISKQVKTFISRMLEHMSLSSKRNATRNLAFLTKYIRSNDGLGEPRDAMEDINLLSIDRMRADMHKDRMAAKGEPYSLKYWADIYSDWNRFGLWQMQQEGNKLKKNYFSAEHIPRPNPKKFTKRKTTWEDALELEPFLNDCKDRDQALYWLTMTIRWTSIDTADYFDMKPCHMEQRRDGWYITKERAKEPGMHYNVPIHEKVLAHFLEAKDKSPSPDFRMFTGFDYKDHQRESWGVMISWRRKRVFERLFPGTKVKTFKDLRRTFSDYFQRQGVPLGAIQEWMGHADGSGITQANYSDWTLTGSLMRKASPSA